MKRTGHKNDNLRGIISKCLILGSLITLGLRVPTMNIVAAALCVVFFFQANKEDLMGMMIFLVSFASIFKLQIGGFTFYNLLWVIALARLLKLECFSIPRSSGIAWFLFSTYAFITGFFVDLAGTITVICSLSVAMLFCAKGLEDYSLRKIVLCAALGVLLTSCIAILGTSVFPRLSPLLNIATVRYSAGQYYYRFSGLLENPNYYTMLPSVIQAAICVRIIEKKATLVDYLCFVGLAVFGFMSVSKSYMLTFAAMVFLLVAFYGKNDAKRFLGGIGIAVVLGMIILLGLGSDTIEAILFRAESDMDAGSNIQSITSGRSGMWLYYLNYLFDNPAILLFGKGLGAANLPIGASHNYYIDILYHLGIIGGGLYLTCLIRIFRSTTHTKRVTSIYCYLPLIIFVIRAMARNLIMSEQLVFFFMLCTLSRAKESRAMD